VSSTCYPLPTPTYLAEPGRLPVTPSRPTDHKNIYYATRKQLLKLVHPAAKAANMRMAVLDPKGTKKRAVSPPSPRPAKRIALNTHQLAVLKRAGRRSNDAANYSSVDVIVLLDIMGEELPVSRKDWLVVTGRFAKWAQDTNRPARNKWSLMCKFKQACICLSQRKNHLFIRFTARKNEKPLR
jgi:hypothetical protein